MWHWFRKSCSLQVHNPTTLHQQTALCTHHPNSSLLGYSPLLTRALVLTPFTQRKLNWWRGAMAELILAKAIDGRETGVLRTRVSEPSACSHAHVCVFRGFNGAGERLSDPTCSSPLLLTFPFPRWSEHRFGWNESLLPNALFMSSYTWACW